MVFERIVEIIDQWAVSAKNGFVDLSSRNNKLTVNPRRTRAMVSGRQKSVQNNKGKKERAVVGKLIVIHSELASQLGKEFPVFSLPTYLGRSGDNDVILKDASVSRSHAKITQLNNQRLLHDLGSRFGTYLNGEKLKSTPEPLVYGDKVQLGDTATLIYAPVRQQKEKRDSAGEVSNTAGFEDDVTMVKERTSG